MKSRTKQKRRDARLCNRTQIDALTEKGIRRDFKNLTYGEARRLLETPALPTIPKATTPRRDEKRAHHLRYMPYADYLKTRHWLRMRLHIYRRCGGKCELCGYEDPKIEVHHLTYERRGSERLEDLIALCQRCHDQEHGFIVPAAVKAAAQP